MSTFKFAIMGAAAIAEKFCDAVRRIDGAEVIAVAGKTEQRLKNFAEKQGIPRYYVGYEELLKNVPHREFLDLSVVYRNVFRIDKAGSESVLIDNSMLKSMGIDIRFHMPDNQVLLPDVFYQLPAVRKVLNCKYRQSS